MTLRPVLPLKYQEAVHVAAFLRRIATWDASALVRIQSRGGVAAFWATTPMGALAFIAVPMSRPLDEALDVGVKAARLRDILGDLSLPSSANREVDYPLPDAMSLSVDLLNLPPQGNWSPGERLAATAITEIVEGAIAEFHRRAAEQPTADRKTLDAIGEKVWQGPGLAGFPLKGLHAARQLGFLHHANARVEFGTLNGWKRMVTPSGQIYFNDNPTKPKLRVL